MTSDRVGRGEIIRYSYLWLSQARHSETGGRKDRPVCLVIRTRDPITGFHHLVLLAISSQPPSSSQTAIEIPEIERRRGGLGRYGAAWIYVSEYNYDIAERSYYFDPGSDVLGSFSEAFLKRIAVALRTTILAGRGRVDRNK